VKIHTRYYTDYELAGVSTDQAALNLGAARQLMSDVSWLVNWLRSGIRMPEIKDAIVLAHWRSQSYKNEDYVDLWDFCDLLENSCARLKECLVEQQTKELCLELGEACFRVKRTIAYGQNRVVLKSCYSGAAFQHSHGLSVYFPWSEYSVEYHKHLAFAKDTGWGDFLQLYVQETRRERRQGVGGVRHFEAGEDSPLAVRQNPSIPGSRGGDVRRCSVKNPPIDFYRDECGTDLQDDY